MNEPINNYAMIQEMVRMAMMPMMQEILRVVGEIKSAKYATSDDLVGLQEQISQAMQKTYPRIGISGRVQVEGKFLLSETDKLMGVFQNLNKDSTKRYVRVNRRTLTATEESGPLPLDGEADCIWIDKEEHYGDIIV